MDHGCACWRNDGTGCVFLRGLMLFFIFKFCRLKKRVKEKDNASFLRFSFLNQISNASFSAHGNWPENEIVHILPKKGQIEPSRASLGRVQKELVVLSPEMIGLSTYSRTAGAISASRDERDTYSFVVFLCC